MAWPSTTACRVVLTSSFSMSCGGYFFLLGQVGVGRLHVFFEIERLVLQRMRQFVRQHRLLLVGAQPVEQIHGLGFGIVISRHLLFQQHHQKFPQVEVSGQKAKFLEHQLGAAQALGIFVLAGVLGDVVASTSSRLTS